MSASVWTLARNGDDETLRYLITMGHDVNRTNGSCEAPLHLACKAGKESTVRLLLDAGAVVSVRNGLTLDTPLHHAASGNHRAAVSLLLERGADPRATNKEGKSAVDLAREGNYRILLSLLRTGDEPIPCSLRCGATVLRRLAAAHMERTCPQRTVLCRLKCGMKIAFADQVKHEAKTCMEAEIDCWAGCGARERRRMMRHHTNVVCPLAAKTTCRFGCTVLRSQQFEHEDAHLHRQAMLWTPQELGYWMLLTLRAITAGKSVPPFESLAIEEATREREALEAAAASAEEAADGDGGAASGAGTSAAAAAAATPASGTALAEGKGDDGAATPDDKGGAGDAAGAMGSSVSVGGDVSVVSDVLGAPEDATAAVANGEPVEVSEEPPRNFVARLDGVKQRVQDSNTQSADDYTQALERLGINGRMLSLFSYNTVAEESLGWLLHIAGLSVAHRVLLQDEWMKRIKVDNTLVEAVASQTMPIAVGSATKFKLVGEIPATATTTCAELRQMCKENKRLGWLVPAEYHFIRLQTGLPMPREVEPLIAARTNGFAMLIEEEVESPDVNPGPFGDAGRKRKGKGVLGGEGGATSDSDAAGAAASGSATDSAAEGADGAGQSEAKA